MILKCGTIISWKDPSSLSMKVGKIVEVKCDHVRMYNSYDVIESDTGLFEYNIGEEHIMFLKVDDTWIDYGTYKYLKNDEEAVRYCVRHDYRFNSFEAILHPDSESVDCKLEFSASFEDASKIRNTFENNRDMADSMVYGMCNYLDMTGTRRRSGRYPWENASAIRFQGKYYKTKGLPVPKKVIFNGPATVVLWTDNTKTVVKKSEDEPDDREKALMYCVFKKFLDDKKRDMDRYLKLFYKVLKEESNDEEKKD